jgi:hypothetical protein
MVGALHNYLEELMEEFGDLLSSDFEELSPISQKYVAMQVHKKLRVALADGEEDLGDAQSRKSFLATVHECSQWVADPKTLASSPSRMRLEGFFRFGSNAIDRSLTQFRNDGTKFFEWLKSDTRFEDYFNRLQSAINVRNDVAHGTFNLQITLREFRVYRVTIESIVRKAEEFVQPTLAAARSTSAGD